MDPLACPKCGKAMKIVAIVEDKCLVEATLRDLGLWEDPAPRGPPSDLSEEFLPVVEREPWWEDETGGD